MVFPPKLRLSKDAVLVVVIVVLPKSVMKMLYQNFCIIGENIMVKDVMNRDTNKADSLILLKWTNSKPNPITVKIAVMIKRLLNIVSVEKLTGLDVDEITWYSLAHPYTQTTPAIKSKIMMPITLLAFYELS